MPVPVPMPGATPAEAVTQAVEAVVTAILPVAPPALRIQQRQDEIRFRRRAQPPLDHVPGSEQIAQTDDGEVVAERRSKQCGGRIHR